MNKKTVILVFFTCIVGIFAGSFYYKNAVNQLTAQGVTSTGLPLSLDIPAIHAHAAVESVGLDKNNLMGVPDKTKDVAWYKLGPEPGQTGNAVIDGHVDTQTGAPAVFAKLGKLKIGDTITVTESQNAKHTFQVTSVESLPTATFPVNRIFGSTPGAHLNLITCDGTWDKKTANYSKRLVVFSKLIN